MMAGAGRFTEFGGVPLAVHCSLGINFITAHISVFCVCWKRKKKYKFLYITLLRQLPVLAGAQRVGACQDFKITFSSPTDSPLSCSWTLNKLCPLAVFHRVIVSQNYPRAVGILRDGAALLAMVKRPKVFT